MFDTSRFVDKWLRDINAEQGRGGGIPMVVPKAASRWPTMATSCWGDVCVIAPWEEYLARGDISLLRRQYPTMKHFLAAAGWWARFLSVRPSRQLIWQLPFHWGDWAAPEGNAVQWVRRSKWIATAYYAHSCAVAAGIADILGEAADAAHYRELSAKISRAYVDVFTDGHGRLKEEFETAYVLPLAFGMVKGRVAEQMVTNLLRLIRTADGHLRTGFPGTPHILFALSDAGRLDAAYDLLLQTSSPSWLYMVQSGGTTIWERWDALRPDGTVNTTPLVGSQQSEDSTGGMVSFNHYAAGAVGAWMHRRIAGIEPLAGGYARFRIAPRPGGGLTHAQAAVNTPYGTVSSSWRITDGVLRLAVTVPVSTVCEVVLPDGVTHECRSGQHDFECEM